MPNANEYMLKQADAEAIYQKKLNAGTGINIDPITDTISATGSGGSTVTYTPNITTGMILGVLGINGSSNPIKSPSLIAGQNINITQDPTTGALTFSSANAAYNDMIGADGTNPGTHGLAPAPAATDNTKFLKGDGTWGDPVTPNPSGTATATLSKLSINNTVYNLAGGTTTYFGTTDPSNSVGNNGDLYFKYTSTPITVEKEITLPTIPYGQNTYIEINDFSSYTDFTFTYTDVYSASLEKTVNISDIPESNDPLNGSRYEVYTFNSWLYLFVGKDSNGLWVVRGENCSFTKLVGTYTGAQIDINKAYIKIDDEWIEQPSGGGTEVIANPSGPATATLSKLQIDNTVYGVSGGGGGGGSFVGLTKAEYDALPTVDKEDTSKLYMVQEGGGTIADEDLILTDNDWQKTTEGSMRITWTNSTIVFDWIGGSSIGGNIVKKVAIPANASKIKFKMTTGSAYSTTVDRFKVFIGVRTTYQIGIILPYYSTTDWLASDSFATTNSVWEGELDLSDVNVDTYLYVTAHGWDLTINELEIEITDGSVPTRHTYWNNAKWSQWNQVKEITQGEYNALTTTQKQDGSIYMTHDGGYDFISYDGGKIIVRVNTSTGETIWFFNGFTKESADIDVPTELMPYLPTVSTSGQVYIAWAWTDDTSTTRNGAIGFLYPATPNVKIRSWNNDYSVLYGGTFWATLIIDGAQEQQSNYTSPTEGLSLLPNRIYYNNTLYADLGDSSGSEIDTNKIVLFKNGQWQNQNIMEITPYLGTIINNKLHCQGMHCGIVVSDVSGMTWSGSYKVIIEVESSNGFSFQIGQCTPTSDLDGIIRAGTNRITYTNDSITDGEHYILKANAIDATRGIFLGGYYLDSSIDYYITKISLEYNNEKEYT